MSSLITALRTAGRASLVRVFGARAPGFRLGKSRSRTRLLFVANALIPTLQLSFLKPLAALIDAGDIAVELLSEQQLKECFGNDPRSAAASAWLGDRFKRFRPTTLIFCRYSGPGAEHLMALAGATGIPTVFHIDDDLLNVPREIGQKKFEFHNHPARQATVRHLLANADLVYCSTEALRRRFLSYGYDRRYYVGNIYCAGTVMGEPVAGNATRIGYMGFDHAHDFELVLPALIEVMRLCPEVVFELFGAIPKPPMLDEFANRVVLIPPVPNYGEFMAKLASRRWAVGICPLAKTIFNEVKANTKWVEYTSVGAAAIASRDTVYNDCCGDGRGWLVDTKAEWREALLALISDETLRLAQIRSAQATLREDYSVSGLRDQVLQVLAIARS